MFWQVPEDRERELSTTRESDGNRDTSMAWPYRVAEGETGWSARPIRLAGRATGRTACPLGAGRFHVLGRSTDLEKRTKAA